MHELSIAVSIVELVEEEAARRGGVQVEAVHLRLGLMSGVVKEALLSCFELACERTMIEGCKLVVETVEGKDLEVRALQIVELEPMAMEKQT